MVKKISADLRDFRIMAPTRARSRSIRLSTVIALLLALVSTARGFPLSGRELDSAVDGVQKYLESSGFPKMTRGEVLDFLDEFSRNSRVSRSEKSGGGDSKANASADVASQTPAATRPMRKEESTSAAAVTKPKIPDGESPLNYGYPMSLNERPTSERSPVSTTSMIFVTVPPAGNSTAADERSETTSQPRFAPKKSTVPAVDLNAYVKFKKIPEAKNLKIDDEMKDFLNGFGLLDPPRSGDTRAQRRNDDDAAAAAAAPVGAESADASLLKSVLAETGAAGDANASQIEPLIASISKSDHVFNPTGAAVKTVDVNRIAKIVENIRLLTDDNGTMALPPEVIQQRFENITAAISAIDRPADDGGKADGFNGYEVFFDDSSKEVDSDLPAESPSAAAAAAGSGGESLIGTLQQPQQQPPPDPLSTEELQRLSEKNNKSDVKRQQPAAAAADGVASEDPEAVPTSSEAVQVTATEFLEATSFKAASDAPPATGEPTNAVGTTAAPEANPSLSQLAESFGGGETASEAPPAAEDPVASAVPANRPKNGLYFYVDWNSFLTVNNGQRNQVNLRFAPKAGNPAHFLRVTVP